MDILRIKDGNNKDIYGFLQMSWGLITVKNKFFFYYYNLFF